MATIDMPIWYSFFHIHLFFNKSLPLYHVFMKSYIEIFLLK